MHVEVNGIRVRYEVSGPPSAPWLVCLHSLCTDLTVWDGHAHWLTPRFRMLRYDVRGHGSTEASPPPYSLELLVADAFGVLDALEIEQAHLMGLSIGGMTALGVALTQPERVRSLVAAGTRADSPPSTVALWDSAIEKSAQQGIGAVIDDSLRRWFSTSFRESDPEGVARIAARARRTSLDGFTGCARAAQNVDYRSRLPEISCPSLFVVGELDLAAPPDVMHQMATSVPGGVLRVIPGAAHLTPVEVPTQFRDTVDEFLTRVAIEEFA